MINKLEVSKYAYRALLGAVLFGVGIYAFITGNLDIDKLIGIFILITGIDRVQDGLQTIRHNKNVNGGSK